MSDTKFTKGEWYAHPNGIGCGGIAIVNTPNGCVIPKSEDIANQDLIAAAPEMYEMLNRWVNSVDCVDDNYQDGLKEETIELLAEARGEL